MMRILVIAIVGSVVAAFLYAGGWLTPGAVTPARIIDTFEQVNGEHAGFRRNHAKGLGASGWFESNGGGARLSKAVVFAPGRFPVVARFALAGGMPNAVDTFQSVRSLAVRISLPDGEEWRMGMNDIPVFPVNTPEAFREQLVALSPDHATGKPDPRAAGAFFASHPESERAISLIKARKIASGFENDTYNGLNAFELVDAAGKRTPVRWAMVPVDAYAAPGGALPQDRPNAVFDALIERVKRGPVQWHLMLTIGQPGDPTKDATLAWPEGREKVDVGTLTVDRVESEETSPARALNFDPLILPDGIAGSDDPLLSARSAAYSVSFTRRQGEAVSPSAVTAREVGAR
jgi:catalase